MLQLSQAIKLKIQDGQDVILDVELKSKKLTKKNQKDILKLVEEVNDEDTTAEQMDQIEEASKIRFDKQISGAKADMAKVREIADEYGYSLVLNQIDEQVQAKQGKR